MLEICTTLAGICISHTTMVFLYGITGKVLDSEFGVES